MFNLSSLYRWECIIVFSLCISNTNFNINLSLCYDFDPNCSSGEAHAYVADKLRNNSPFEMPDEVIDIRDKVKNIRVHRISGIYLNK